MTCKLSPTGEQGIWVEKAGLCGKEMFGNKSLIGEWKENGDIGRVGECLRICGRM